MLRAVIGNSMGAVEFATHSAIVLHTSQSVTPGSARNHRNDVPCCTWQACDGAKPNRGADCLTRKTCAKPELQAAGNETAVHTEQMDQEYCWTRYQAQQWRPASCLHI